MPLTTLVVLFGILGGLAGGLAYMFKVLVQTKDQRIDELEGERDYWRNLVGIEARLADPAALPILPSGTQTLAVAAPVTLDTDKAKDKDKEKKDEGDPGRFAYYSLAIQAVISMTVIVLSFWIIATPTDPSINQAAINLIVFIIGVWLGRGADYLTRVKN